MSKNPPKINISPLQGARGPSQQCQGKIHQHQPQELTGYTGSAEDSAHKPCRRQSSKNEKQAQFCFETTFPCLTAKATTAEHFIDKTALDWQP